MSVYEVPKSSTEELELAPVEDVCGVNCNWGFGVGVVIAMVGPLPGPT